MRYNSEALEIKVVISGNGLLFKEIKISLGLLTSARKKHAVSRKSQTHLSTNTNNRIRVYYRSQYSKQILVLSTVFDQKVNITSLLCKTSGCRLVFIPTFSSKLPSRVYEISNYLNDTYTWWLL